MWLGKESMLDLEKERAVQLKASYLFEAYRLIVAEFLPLGVDIETFMQIFSQHFAEYQNTNPRKLDPDSIREGKVSCSSAAALAGVWWMEQFPQLAPVFLVEETSRSGHSRTAAHVNVALPLAGPIDKQAALSAFYSPSRGSDQIRIIDWTEHSKMKASNPQKIYEVYPVQGVVPYLRNRVAALGLPKKYSSRGAFLGQWAANRQS